MHLGKVVILGRPNVGKSALFNRLVKRRLAIVFDRPGVTRDCHERTVRLPSGDVTFVDTPGVQDLQFAKTIDGMQGAKGASEGTPSFDNAELEAAIFRQAVKNINEADLILFTLGGNEVPEQMFSYVRKFGKPIILVVNKCDLLREDRHAVYSLGMEPVFVSAEHGTGMYELIDAIDAELWAQVKARDGRGISDNDDNADDEAYNNANSDTNYNANDNANDGAYDDANLDEDCVQAEDEDDYAGNERKVKISIIGRPNVGKSTLVNVLLGKEAQIVANTPGVTRDTVEFDWEYDGRMFELADTAGIRRNAKISDRLEKISVSLAINSMNFSHVCVLVVDAPEIEESDYKEFVQQDLLLASSAIKEGRGVVIALNKWDLVKNKKLLRQKVDEAVQYSGLKFTPVIPVSAKKREGLRELMRAIIDVEQVWNTRISTAKLNKWLRDLVSECPPPATAMRRSKLKYITQTSTRPPQFVIFGTKMDDVPASYRQFLINNLKQTFHIAVPVRFRWRQQGNPYDNRGQTGSRRHP
ncbi:MAG: ribosome biogenesis GTPase Der [Holosporales bacterium]|jgi:GTP-binding protein|nr:ribosome biogenesis GTPase Der [Holosporales bacterium]